MRHKLAASDAFGEVMKVMNPNELMLNSPDTLPMLLARFASMTLGMASEFIVLSLPDLA